MLVDQMTTEIDIALSPFPFLFILIFLPFHRKVF